MALQNIDCYGNTASSSVKQCTSQCINPFGAIFKLSTFETSSIKTLNCDVTTPNKWRQRQINDAKKLRHLQSFTSIPNNI